MADGHGGYRKPAHPAATSGQGAMSQRTDGGPGSKQMVRQLTGGAYGDRQDFQQIESGAPMAPAPSPQQPATPEAAGLIPMDADTTAPDEPTTHGAATGDGAGTEILGGNQPDLVAQDAQAMAAYLPALEKMSNLPDATPSFRSMVLRLKARMG